MSGFKHPSPSGTERQLLTEYLDWYRAAILRKMEGASDETLRKRIVASETTLLGIVKHLAWVEISWFQIVFAGRQVDDPWTEGDPDSDWRIKAGETTEEILQFYRDACAESRAIVDGAADLDALSVGEAGDNKHNLRRIMIHMMEETARHAGHADILRESIDGQTGE